MTGTDDLAKLQDDIYAALRAWHEAEVTTSPLADLHLFQEACRQCQQPHQATNAILLEAMTDLAVKYPLDADLLRLHFLDGLVMHVVANRLNVGESTAYRQQKEALYRLAAIIQAKEHQARLDYQTSLEKRLPLPPASELIGVEQPLETLLKALARPGSVWLISIEGLGGIGKTALAGALLRQPGLNGYFDQMAWVSAKQQELLPGLGLSESTTPTLTAEALVEALLAQLAPDLPLTLSPAQKQEALIQRLKQTPTLAVIDNLETVVDYQTLLPLLRRLANPSCFVLTSRHSLCAQPDVFCCALPELSRADTLRLIRREATRRGLSLLAQATDNQLGDIYAVVGGNPLALQLVVGQIALLPLNQVLDQLKQAQGKSINDLYTYIYWQAWRMLDPASQQLLLVMPLAQNGGIAQLLALTGLKPEALSQAIQQLAILSLLQVSGDLDERRYSIHRLTETFLLHEAIKWGQSS